MSQFNYETAINPAVNGGNDLNAALDAWELAINSNQSGASRPSWLQANGTWVQVVSATVEIFNYFDGTDDIAIFTVNPVANTVVLSSAVFQDSDIGAASLPAGTTAQRPTPAAGMFRFNSTDGSFEGYNGTAWGSIGGGATGGGGDDVFYENAMNVTTNYTLPTGKNAMSAGPIIVDDGVVVTVPDGANWTVV